ncbi:MAG: hypothetical protein HY805_03050 [Nitrospirae bacterium]|nr:hypothetical protein [Nitrospirota bacterium]
MAMIRGKSFRAMASDIAEGYAIVNPLFLKPLDNETLKNLFQEVIRFEAEIRAEKFPQQDSQAIRMRNMRLQRLHSTKSIIKNFARERRILII